MGHSFILWIFFSLGSFYRKKKATVNLLECRTIFTFFGADFPLSVHCFDCSFVSCVKWWSYVLSTMVINWRKNSLYYCETSRNTWLKHLHIAVFVQLLVNAASILRKAFSYPNFRSICDVQHFLKCLTCLLALTLLVDGHPIPFCGFSSPFLASAPHLVSHCDIRFGSSYSLV